ncbi:MAG: ABC transporter ATP-binding protein, partial [Bryobacteraceae bacterium]|nr:ABC transporter ATP-binding protein [Bryobacteraceae bacterium]
IFVIDEVLGVGDSAFNMKCLNKIRELRMAGKTLLFVSHNPATVREFCDRAIWLHEGEMVMDGPAREVVEGYSSFMANPEAGLPARVVAGTSGQSAVE